MPNNKKPTFVKISITKLQSLALEKDLNELGKFHKELAIELGKEYPSGKTEASELAKELLECSRNSIDKATKGAKPKE